MMDMEAIAAGRENFSSAQDLGNIFVRIYHHQCVDYPRDEIMLEFGERVTKRETD